jgi:hypothetical protein
LKSKNYVFDFSDLNHGEHFIDSIQSSDPQVTIFRPDLTLQCNPSIFDFFDIPNRDRFPHNALIEVYPCFENSKFAVISCITHYFIFEILALWLFPQLRFQLMEKSDLLYDYRLKTAKLSVKEICEELFSTFRNFLKEAVQFNKETKSWSFGFHLESEEIKDFRFIGLFRVI